MNAAARLPELGMVDRRLIAITRANWRSRHWAGTMRAMPVFSIVVRTGYQGLFEITQEVERVVGESGVSEGLCTIFIRHTSASLVIQENADPSVLSDLQLFLKRLVPESGNDFEHTIEGPDDMPAHIKGALSATSLSIPVRGGRLGLGQWQGIFVWEHRHRRDNRECLVHIGS